MEEGQTEEAVRGATSAEDSSSTPVANGASAGVAQSSSPSDSRGTDGSEATGPTKKASARLHGSGDASKGASSSPTAAKVQELRQKTEDDPEDIEAWQDLFQLAETLPIADARPVYRSFFAQFPTASLYWKAFAEHEHREGETAAVQKILQQSLQENPEPELWKFYLDFVYETKLQPALERVDAAREETDDALHAAKETMVERRQNLLDAYNFALGRVGKLPGAESLWEGLLDFLRSAPTASERDQDGMRDRLRKEYQAAVCIPLANVTQIWDQYVAFERETAHEALFQSLVGRCEGPYRQAVRVQEERAFRWTGIQAGLLPAKPRKEDSAAAGASSADARPHVQLLCDQAQRWRSFLAYEAANPLGLDDDEAQKLLQVHYDRAFCSLRYFPDLWLDLAMVQMDQEKRGIAAATLLRGVDVIRGSELLGFAAADLLEEMDRKPDAKRVYEGLEQQCPSPLVFIQFQRFARRTEGPKAAQKVFSRARKSSVVSAAVYIAAAHMEAFTNKQPDVARNIFGLARKKFPGDVSLLLANIEFLIQEGDDANVRALFESGLDSLDREESRVVWERYLDYEMHRAPGGGSLATVRRLEQRIADAFPDEMMQSDSRHRVLRRFHRYQHYDLEPQAAVDSLFLSRYPPLRAWRHTGEGRLERETATRSSSLLQLGTGGVSSRPPLLGSVPSSRPPLLPPPGTSTEKKPLLAAAPPAEPGVTQSAPLELVPGGLQLPPFLHRLLATVGKPPDERRAGRTELAYALEVLAVPLCKEPAVPPGFVAPESAIGTGERTPGQQQARKRAAPSPDDEDESFEPAATRPKVAHDEQYGSQ